MNTGPFLPLWLLGAPLLLAIIERMTTPRAPIRRDPTTLDRHDQAPGR